MKRDCSERTRSENGKPDNLPNTSESPSDHGSMGTKHDHGGGSDEGK